MYGRINTACMDRQKKARCPSITKTPSDATRGRTTTRAQGANPPEHNAERLIMREKTARRVTDAMHQDTPPLPLNNAPGETGDGNATGPLQPPDSSATCQHGSGRERTARTGPVTRSSPKRPGRYKPNQAQALQRSHPARRATGTSSAQRQRDGMHTKRKSRAKNTGISTRARATHNK